MSQLYETYPCYSFILGYNLLYLSAYAIWFLDVIGLYIQFHLTILIQAEGYFESRHPIHIMHFQLQFLFRNPCIATGCIIRTFQALEAVYWCDGIRRISIEFSSHPLLKSERQFIALSTGLCHGQGDLLLAEVQFQ